MDYFCGYYPRPGDTAKQCSMEQKGARLSLLIQHCAYRQGEVLLACVGLPGQETEALMESLFRWFRGLTIRSGDWKNQDRTMRRWAREIEKLVNPAEFENRDNINIAGLLCLGHLAIPFRSARMETFVVQEDIGRAYLRPLSLRQCSEADIAMEVVAIQPNVGIVVMPQELAECVREVTLGECMKMRNITSEEQLQKQLEELIAVAKEASAANSTDVGAIVVKMGGETHDRRLA